jgi:hypothetical protein
MVNFCSIFLILGGDNPVGQRSGARGAHAPVIKRLIRGAFSIKLAYVILSENEPLRLEMRLQTVYIFVAVFHVIYVLGRRGLYFILMLMEGCGVHLSWHCLRRWSL